MHFYELTTKELKKKSGIYKLKTGGHIYIGSSKDLYSRLIEHRRDLFNNVHTNEFLQRSVNKYGIDNVEIEIIEFCDPKIRTKREAYWIKELDADLNFKDPVTLELSEYSKQKLSESIKKGRAEGKYKQPTERCKIEQYDLHGNFVTEYENIDDAAAKTGFLKNEIRRCCGGYTKGHIHKGCRFRYAISKTKKIKFEFNEKRVGKYFDFYYLDKNGKEQPAFVDCRDVWKFFGHLLNTENPDKIIIIPKLKNLVNIGNPDRGNHALSLLETEEKDQRLDEVILPDGAEEETSTSARQ